MKSITNNLTKTIVACMLSAGMIMGLTGCSSSNSSNKEFEMMGVKFTPELTRKELKQGISGQSPDKDKKNLVDYDKIDGFEDIPGNLYVTFKPNGKLETMIYTLDEKNEAYDELYDEVVKQLGEPQHKENINDLRTTARCYWRVSEDIGLLLYRGESWKDAYDGFYSVYLELTPYSEKKQNELSKRQSYYDKFAKGLSKDDEKVLKEYLKLNAYQHKPVNKFLKDYNGEFDSYDDELDDLHFVASTKLVGENIKVEAIVSDPNESVSVDDGESGKIEYFNMSFDKNVSKSDTKFLDKFTSIFGEWKWDSEDECAVYDNGFFNTYIYEDGDLESDFDDYEIFDTKYMVSTSTKKHEGLDECDVQKYIDSGKEKNVSKVFDDSGRTYSNQGSDIATALNNMSNQNTIGISLEDEQSGQQDGKIVTIWKVYKDNEYTNMIIMLMYDQTTGRFNGLSCSTTEEGEAPVNIDAENLKSLYFGLIAFTDASLSATDITDCFSEATNGAYEENGRVYELSAESNYLRFSIINK